jgi:8-oxo-dGTP pyrophosphatase MutT (NUDIX family)
MDYLLELRKFVGHAPLLMVGAAVLIVDQQDRLLLMKRSDSGCWGPPGGAVELGEKVEAAARREVQEETGLEIGKMALFGVFSGPELYYRYPNGDEVYNITIVYRTHDWHGEVRLNGEHTHWRWFAAQEIPDDLSPPIKPVIDQFKKERSTKDTV